MPISTVGAAQSMVTDSASIFWKTARGSTFGKQICAPPTAVTIQTKVHPLA